jgi:RNA polymerase sigma-70 factor (ECF subfamily)
MDVPRPEAFDEELLSKVARGDAEAFGQVYDRFGGVLFALLLRMVRDAGAAEDLLQEVFLQIWEKAKSYDPRLGKPLGWAVALARNRAIDRLRAEARGQRLLNEVAVEQAAHGVSPENCFGDLLGGETAGLVRAALARLPAEQRQSIEMAFFGGLSQSEIAAALQVPLGTVKARIRRGMLQLRESLRKVL